MVLPVEAVAFAKRVTLAGPVKTALLAGAVKLTVVGMLAGGELTGGVYTGTGVVVLTGADTVMLTGADIVTVPLLSVAWAVNEGYVPGNTFFQV